MSCAKSWLDHPGPAGRALPSFGSLLPLTLAVLLMVLGHAVPAAAGRPPNVIVVLVDDLGARDLGCCGSTFHQTPHLDRLAQEGMRFTSAYSACTVCSPTRASLLTGQYPARLHLTDWIAGHERPHARLKVPDWSRQLSTNEWNLARAFREAGYATASIGKWHLGPPDHYPEHQGFDLNLGGTSRGQPPSYHAPYRIPTLPEGPPGEFLTDREAAEACAFIERQRDRPFFLYLAHHAVHTPLMGRSNVIERYRRTADPNAGQRNPTYAALLESVDDAMGRLRHTLATLGLSERTIIVFTSDNGGLILGGTNAPTSNAPLRSGKGSPYEGGVRVPLIIHGPGRVAAGTLNDTPVITPDLYPTLLDLAGVADQRGHRVDGRSLVPLLRGARSLRRDALFWHYPHYHPGGATPYSAIRRGPLKLLEFLEDGRRELYDLQRDPEERHNLAETRPGQTRSLQRQLARWRREVGAQMPSPNPDFDPARDR